MGNLSEPKPSDCLEEVRKLLDARERASGSLAALVSTDHPAVIYKLPTWSFGSIVMMQTFVKAQVGFTRRQV